MRNKLEEDFDDFNYRVKEIHKGHLKNKILLTLFILGFIAILAFLVSMLCLCRG